MMGLGKPGRNIVKFIEWYMYGLPSQQPAPCYSSNMIVGAAYHGWDFQETKSSIPKTLVAKALLGDYTAENPLTWMGYTVCSWPRENQFQQYQYPIPGAEPIHMIWTDTPCWTTCWNGGNTMEDALRDERIECVVAQHPWMENDCLFADILLPINTKFEEEDVGQDNGGGQFGSIFYEAWQLSAVTEETDREAFFSKIFRVYASVLFCCVAGIIMLCQLLMRVFKAEYFDAWTFVPFLTLCSMLTCMNQFLNSIYVVYKRSTGSLVTMLAGAVLNLILNYCFIRLWGPWGVTLASFLSLMLVFLLRAYSTRGLLEIDFHPAWLILNLALVLAEIWCMMKLTHWALPVVGITAVVCVMNIREVLSMLDTLIGKFLKKKKA